MIGVSSRYKGKLAQNETNKVHNSRIHPRFHVIDRHICEGQESAHGGDLRFPTSREHADETGQVRRSVARNRPGDTGELRAEWKDCGHRAGNAEDE